MSTEKNEMGTLPETDAQPQAGRADARGSRRRALVEGSIWSVGVLLVVALVGILNYFGMKYYKRWDWTSTSLYSLSEQSESVLAGLDRDVDATMMIGPDSSVYEDSKELLERYAAASKRFHFEVVDPQRNIARAKQLVERFNLQSLDVVVFEAGDDRRLVQAHELADFDYSAMQYGGKPSMTAFKGEEAFTGAVLALVEQKKPKVLFTTGHGERGLDAPDADGLSQIRELLGNENIDLESWASLGKEDVPDGTDLLVVAGPRNGLVPPELDAFGRYLDRGGRMLVLIDPELTSEGGIAKTGLEAWLSGRGVDVGDDLVVDPSSTVPFYGDATIFVSPTGTSPVVTSLETQQLSAIVSLARSVRAGSLPAEMEAQTLLETSSDGWGETDLANLREVAKQDTDLAAPVPLGVAVAAREKPKRQAGFDEEEELSEALEAAGDASADAPKWRLVVFGDSDFASNALLGASGNPVLVANAFNWLLERQQLLGIGPKTPEKVRLALTPGQLRAVTWTTVAGMPALAVVAGILVWFRRRR